MTVERYVLLSLGHVRAAWFRDVTVWATSGVLPAEIAKCVSVTEVRQRLASAQPHSALLVQAGQPGLDRDLIHTAAQAGCPTIVIDPDDQQYDWMSLGAQAVVSGRLNPAMLLTALTEHATVIGPYATGELRQVVEEFTTHHGRLVAVCGPGGTGTSTVAVSLAQGLADDVMEAGHVLLADFVRNGEQAMLHDAADVMPSVEELVEAHRNRRPAAEEVRSLTFTVEHSGYQLLLGLRRPQGWSALPPRAVEAAVDSLRRSFRTVICDIDADFEGESGGGSLDVEERNALSRTAVRQADAVLVVGNPGMKGTHSLARTLRALLAFGVDSTRIVTIINRAPRNGLVKAELTRTLATLMQPNTGSSGSTGSPVIALTGPIFLPERPVDLAFRDGARLPKQITEPVVSAVRTMFDRNTASVLHLPSPDPAVEPGSLSLADHNKAVGI